MEVWCLENSRLAAKELTWSLSYGIPPPGSARVHETIVWRISKDHIFDKIVQQCNGHYFSSRKIRDFASEHVKFVRGYSGSWLLK